VTAFTDANALARTAFPASTHDTHGTIHRARRLHPGEAHRAGNDAAGTVRTTRL